MLQVVGKYSYKLQPEAKLALNKAGLDPLTAPLAFNRALRSDLEALFVPGHAEALGPSDAAGSAAAGAESSESGSSSMPAAALSQHISEAVAGGRHRHTGNESAAEVPDLRALHRRLQHLESKSGIDDPAKLAVDVSVSCSGYALRLAYLSIWHLPVCTLSNRLRLLCVCCLKRGDPIDCGLSTGSKTKQRRQPETALLRTLGLYLWCSWAALV